MKHSIRGTNRRRNFAPLATLLACISFSPSVFAADAPAAEALFREGKALMQSADYTRACPKFRESYAIEEATGTLLALALCLEWGQQFASAWSTYSAVAARARQEGNKDRERFGRRRVAELRPLLSTIAVRVSPDVGALPGLVVKRDGQRLSAAAWGVALPADGGPHVIDVTADGRTPWRKSVTLAAQKEANVLEVPMLEAEPESARPLRPKPTVAARPEPITAAAAPWRPIGLATAGVGVAGLVVGGVFGLKAIHANRDSKADGHCNGQGCDPVGLSKREEAFDFARTSSVFVVAGSLFVAAGATLYIVGGRSSSASVGLIPALSPAAAGVALNGAF